MTAMIKEISQTVNMPILEKAANYVLTLCQQSIKQNVHFHNFDHWTQVARAALEIGAKEGCSDDELTILQLAALFHDTGYIDGPKGHEERSKKIALIFLIDQDFPTDAIRKVLNCIDATVLEKEPETLLQKIICDADLYHLSATNYYVMQKRLRKEWADLCGRVYSEDAWVALNRSFFDNHTYYTPFGKQVLESRKLLNRQNVLIEKRA